MGWFKDRWWLLWEAYYKRKWLFALLLLVCAGLGTIDYLREFISDWITFPQPGGVKILRLPAPLLGIVIFLVALFWWMLEVALQFKNAVTPAIDVSFNPDAEGIVKTPTEIYGGGVKIRDDEATYVCITLTSRSQKTVRGCVVCQMKLEKRLTSTDKFVNIPLNGSLYLTQTPIDVHPRVPTTVGILKVGKCDSQLGWTVPYPLRLRDVFSDNATYRFTMEVVGDGIAKTS
jgi:hypothetical protein